MSDLWLGLVAGIVVVGALGVAILAAAFAYVEARRFRSEAKKLRADILTTQRNMVTMLGMVVALDPEGKLGTAAQGLAGRIRGLSARISAGVVAEGGELPEPQTPVVHEPPDPEVGWALDCERNGWKDDQDIPLDGVELMDAQRIAAHFHQANDERAKKAG